MSDKWTFRIFLVEIPSVWFEYFLLPLIKVEASFVYSREDYRKAGNPGRDRRGKKTESETACGSEKRNILVSNSLVAIDRLIEIGYLKI